MRRKDDEERCKLNLNVISDNKIDASLAFISAAIETVKRALRYVETFKVSSDNAVFKEIRNERYEYKLS